MESFKPNKGLIFFLILMLLPLVSAITPIHTINNDVLISHPIRVDGYLDSTITANVTVTNSSKVPIIYFQAMTYNSTTGEHQYLIDKNNISSTGLYDYCITATNTELNKTECFDFEVTTTGDNLSLPQSLIYFLLFLISIFFFVISLYSSIKIKWKNPRGDENEVLGINDLKYAKMFFIVFTYVLLLWICWLGWNLSYGYLSFTLMSSLFKTFYYILLTLMYPFIIISFVVLVIRVVDDVKIGKLMERGISSVRV